MWTVVSVIYVISFLWPLSANAKRILALVAAPFFSHQICHHSLTLALHKRGHELTVFTAFPIKNSTLKNYTEIDVSFLIPLISEYQDERWIISQVDSSKKAHFMADKLTTIFLNIPEVKKLFERNNNEKFDAIIIEALSDLSLYLAAHRFNAPLIGEIQQKRE